MLWGVVTCTMPRESARLFADHAENPPWVHVPKMLDELHNDFKVYGLDMFICI